MGDGASEPGTTRNLGAKGRHGFFEGDAYLANNPIIPIRARFVSELLSDLRNGSVLDLGCGDGSVSRALLDRGNDLTLVDFSEAMLRRAQESEPRSAVGRVRYVHSDILEWKVDRSYDAVLCIGLLAHVASPRRTLELVAAATKPGGRCIVEITNVGRPLGWLLARYGRLRQRQGYPLNELSAENLRDLGESLGLTPIAEQRYGFLVPASGRLPYRWQARLESWFAFTFASHAAAQLLVLFRKE
jgi:SAM-dependent methyltransferase